jgi:hypothetical protein
MRYDMQLLFLFVALGLFKPRFSWKGWFGLSLVVLSWLMYCWMRV